MKHTRIYRSKTMLGIILCIIVVFSACKKQEIETQMYTNLMRTKEQNEVKSKMQESGLSNTDLWFTWVRDYNQCVNDKIGVVGKWTSLSEQPTNYDEICSTWVEKNKNTADINCRMSTFMLMSELIDVTDLNPASTYLVSDVKEMKTNENLSFLKDSIGEYTTLYQEIPIAEDATEADFVSAYPKAWEKCNVRFPQGNASMISVVIHDPIKNCLYIGHTGVLLQENESILFIEKLAPSMPYQVIRVKDRSELVKELLSRKDYQGKEGQEPILLENGLQLQ